MLLDKIEADLKTALKEKNEVAVSSLRNLKAAVKNAEIEKKSQLTDDEVSKTVAKKVKQHKDSIESFKSGNRMDLVAIEEAQMKVLEAYLPKQMDETAIANLVTQTIAEMPGADFGKVMKAVMAKTAGAADGAAVSKLVKENLK